MPCTPDVPPRTGADSAQGQAAIAAALFDPARAAPGGARFAVHRNNVVAGLVKALGATFPAVRRLVGEPFFGAMAVEFVRARPPASPVLIAWGGAFPGWLADFTPAAGVPYLADVARLEWAWVEAFNAADATPATADRLARLDPARLPETRLLPHPSFSLVASRFPIAGLWADVTGRRPGGVEAWRAETALVVRPAGDVTVSVVAADHAAFFALLTETPTLAALAETAAEHELDLTAGLAAAFAHSLIADII